MPKLCPTWIHESDLPIPGLPLKNGTAVGDLSNILVATSTTWLIDGIMPPYMLIENRIQTCTRTLVRQHYMMRNRHIL
jgi:hypothetical protein